MDVSAVHIYSLHDPDTDELRYVGKTIHSLEKRLALHVSNAKRGQTRSHCANWVMSLIRQGKEPIVKLIETVPVDYWVEAERRWIASYREYGARLMNLTDGGEGCHGLRHSEESIKSGAEKRRGRSLSAETRRKLSEAAKQRPPRVGWTHSEEAKARMSALAKDRPRPSADRRARIRGIRPETIEAQMSKEYKRSIEWRSKIGLANRGSSNGQAKLTETEVGVIKRLISENELTFTEIAQRFGVSRSLIGMIGRGVRWAHVEMDISGTHYEDDPEFVMWVV